MTRRLGIVMQGATGLMAASLIASGCSRAPKAPSGQVVASVDGVEITEAMLDTEARARGIPSETAGSPQIRKGLLDEAITRALLAGQARKHKLDQTPQVLADLDRMREDFTARLTLASEIPKDVPVNDAAVQRYEASHPELFADRTVFKVDEVRYWNAGDPVGGKYLEGAQTLEEVQGNLGTTRRPSQRRKRVLDPLSADKAEIDRVAATPPDQLYHYDAGGMGVVGLVLGKAAEPVTGERANAIARERLRREGVNQQIAGLIERLKKGAKIVYRR